MAITKTDGTTRIGRQPIPDKLTVYDSEGNSYEKFPIDAHECVASGAYTFERPENADAENESAKEEEVSDEGQKELEEAEGEEGEENQAEEVGAVDYSAMKKAELLALAKSLGRAANNTMSKDKLIEIVSAPEE